MKAYQSLKKILNIENKQLKVEDQIVIGLITIKVLQILIIKKEENEQKQQQQKEQKQCDNNVELKDKTCRICYCNQEKKENILLSICKCEGSLKYVHIECMRRWVLEKQKIKKIGSNKVLYWEKSYCEICMSELEFIQRKNEKDYYLHDIEEFCKNSLLILQAKHRDIINSQAIFIIRLQDNQIIKLGKGKHNDIRIISDEIRDNHSYLHLQNSKLYFNKIFQ